MLNNVSLVTSANLPVSSVSSIRQIGRAWPLISEIGDSACDRPYFGSFSTDFRARCDENESEFHCGELLESIAAILLG